MNAYLTSEAGRQQLAKMGMSFTRGTPEDLRAHLDRETAKWAPIIKDANITLQ